MRPIPDVHLLALEHLAPGSHLGLMGEKKAKMSKLAEFLTRHPRCIYCGDKATTEDHCPPRCFFLGRQWPEGYSFPACQTCNAEARLDEQALGVLVRLNLDKDDLPGAKQDEFLKLIKGTQNNWPAIVQEWTSGTRNDVRQVLRKSFGEMGDDMRRAGYGAINLGSLTHGMINRFLVKLGKALYFRHTGVIFDGIIFANHMSSYDARDDSTAIDAALSFAPLRADLVRANNPLDDQFIYRFNASVELGVVNAVVRFSDQLIFHILAIRRDFQDAVSRQRDNHGLQQPTEGRFDCPLMHMAPAGTAHDEPCGS